jgi:hypothetical protein
MAVARFRARAVFLGSARATGIFIQQAQDDFAFVASCAAEAARKGALEPRLAAASLYFYGEALFMVKH